jgi:hypothetical protein
MLTKFEMFYKMIRIFKILVFSFLLVLSQIVVSQTERNISWLHGFKGSSNDWIEMEAIFEIERNQITSSSTLRVGYPSDIGLNQASSFVSVVIPDDDNSLVIGHSMGGVVARDVNYNNVGHIGGIITVGAPNNGAAIANSLINGDVDRLLTYSCKALLAGPSSEIPFVSILIQSIAPSVICKILSDDLIQPILESQSNQSAIDLSVGSPDITKLAGSTSGTPQISIWGNERSPVHWRLLGSILENDDTHWVKLANDYRSLYNSFFIANTSAAVVGGLAGFLNPSLWLYAGKKAYSASQWKRGVRWFDNSERYWNQLIDCGGDMTEEITVSVQVPSDDYHCDGQLEQGGPYCLAYEQCLDYWAERCDQNPEDCWVDIVLSQFTVTNGRSDGFICEDSQIGPVAIDEYEARDANHWEELQHPNVERRIRNCFERTDVFQTN